MKRNTWLPVSAQECAASAVTEADPVRTAATDLPAATSAFAVKAMTTVSSVELDSSRFSDAAMGIPYPRGTEMTPGKSAVASQSLKSSGNDTKGNLLHCLKNR